MKSKLGGKYEELFGKTEFEVPVDHLRIFVYGFNTQGKGPGWRQRSGNYQQQVCDEIIQEKEKKTEQNLMNANIWGVSRGKGGCKKRKNNRKGGRKIRPI